MDFDFAVLTMQVEQGFIGISWAFLCIRSQFHVEL